MRRTLTWLARRVYRPSVGDPAATDAQNLAPLFPDDRPGRTVLVTLLGVDDGEIAEILAKVRRRLPAADRVVYLTDAAELDLLRRARVILEIWPSLADLERHAGDLPHDAYLRRKWLILLAKWRPGLIIDYGRSLDLNHDGRIKP